MLIFKPFSDLKLHWSHLKEHHRVDKDDVFRCGQLSWAEDSLEPCWILNSISSHSFQMNFICICIHAEFHSKFIHIHFKWIFLVFVFLLNSKVNFKIQFPHIYFRWISFVFVFMLNSKVFLSTFISIEFHEFHWFSLVVFRCIWMYLNVFKCIQGSCRYSGTGLNCQFRNFNTNAIFSPTPYSLQLKEV